MRSLPKIDFARGKTSCHPRGDKFFTGGDGVTGAEQRLDGVSYTAEWRLCGVNYTAELMLTNCFALFFSILTLLKPILNSENLLLYQLSGVPILHLAMATRRCILHHRMEIRQCRFTGEAIEQMKSAAALNRTILQKTDQICTHSS